MTSNTNNSGASAKAHKTNPSEKLYEVFLYKKKDITAIQKKLGELDIDISPILEAELRRDKTSSDKPIRLFDLLSCLEDDIATIQEKIGIVGYTNQEMAEEADKNARVYLRKFEKFHGPLEDDPVFVKKSVNIGQCPCLESKVKQEKLSQIYIQHSK
ncbi:hypothetical protein Glove_426g13 [Diversispora epigaea]|uniref:Uncharacterized protein n=1 Tax=Diversispora epigaea TaxID=1348612 RepID=A0A397GYV5_9GLOM|nr:hypothetical protein Glove_426g13 [Diversispora epigaea]